MRSAIAALAMSFGLSMSVVLHEGAARASSVAYGDGAYTTLLSERSIVLWDASTRTEHLILRPVFRGDASSFYFFVPTPSVPKVAKESPALVEKLASLAGHADDAHAEDARARDAGARAQVPEDAEDAEDAEGAAPARKMPALATPAGTIRGADGKALSAWLKANHLPERPNLHDWAERYLQRGWVLTAVRVASPSTDVTTAEPAPLRFSFASDEPVFPYAQPATDSKDQGEYLARHAITGVDDAPLSLWVFTDAPVAAYQGATLSGPFVHAVEHASASKIAGVVGEGAASWPFDANVRPEWTVTYMRQYEPRVSEGEVTFRATSEASAPGIVAMPAVDVPHTRQNPPPHRHRRALAFLLGIGLVAALVAAWELRSVR